MPGALHGAFEIGDDLAEPAYPRILVEHVDSEKIPEQALQPWTYLVSSWTLDSLLKKRSDLVKAIEPEEATAPEGSEESGAEDPVKNLLDLPEPSP